MWKILARCASGALPSVGMWIIARASGAALAVALVLSGCMPTNTPTRPSLKPSGTPIFASEAEALAAATAAYAAYQNQLDSAFSSYEHSYLQQVASGSALLKAERSVSDYEKLGKRQTGLASIDTMSIVDSPFKLVKNDDSSRIQAYLCLDLSQVDVLGSDGNSVVPIGSHRRFPSIASFAWGRASNVLLVDEDESWTGENFC